MGFIKAFAGAIGGTFADQWKDFLMPKPGVPGTAALFEAVPQGQNAGRGSNTKGSKNVITNGSKIIVPEGTALITFQDGAITGFIAEAGGFEYRSDDQNSKSIFSGDGFLSPLVKTSWERFKFGGQPGAQQLAFYVNLKEIPNNRFGTQSEIYWDDAYLGAQVGAVTRGTYTMKIIDPILFVKNFVPAQYLQPDAPVFDFADMDNDAGSQLFNEVVGSLSAAFSNYTNDPSKGNRITKIQGDQIGFAQSLTQAVEDGYQWKSDRGLEIVKVALVAIEYDEDTKKLLSDVKKADALSGARGSSFMQQSVARGMQAVGENPTGGGGMGMAFMGMGMGAAGNMMGATQQQEATPQSQFIQNQPMQQQQQAPPPMPPQQPMFHAMLGGVQQGPFAMEQLQQMAQAGQLTPNTLVWCAGMPAWAAAGTVPTLAAVFGAVPPPPPPPIM
ncbi:MAG: GYF domain-containing protein [Bacteroidales bacterium]|nr:GYF domain-containing protein [Bacteroidales bacterium]MCL2133847.1 GYF domain-containing protein [Bacteroidales bacterium]